MNAMRKRPNGDRRLRRPPSKAPRSPWPMVRVRVRCKACQHVSGPLILNGTPYCCSACQVPLFGTGRSSPGKPAEGVLIVENPDSAMLAELEALARGEATETSEFASRKVVG